MEKKILNDFLTEVTQNEGAIAILKSIKSTIDDAIADPEKLKALKKSLKKQRKGFENANKKNRPAWKK